MEVKLGQLASRISTIRIVEESKNNFPINAPVDETLEGEIPVYLIYQKIKCTVMFFSSWVMLCSCSNS